jgi:hypothetical protein
VAVDGADMNFKPMTVGFWFYVSEYPTELQFILGKRANTSGDGFYVTIKNRDMCFAHITNLGKDISSKDFTGGFFEKNRWRWFGFAINDDGSGYATMNAQSTFGIADVKAAPMNRAPFTVGNIPAIANSAGFVGKLDQVVVYSRFLKLEELTQIMNTRE